MDRSPLTIIVPMWNERASLPAVLDALSAAPGIEDASLLLVDDGSTDGTGEELDRRAAAMPRLRVIHVRHGGKDCALWRAFRDAATEWIGVMDGDGQYDPGDFVRLMDYAKQRGADGVWGVRAEREDHLLRKVSSWIGHMAKRLFLGGMAVRDPGCGLFIIRRRLCLPIADMCPAPRGQVHCHLAEFVQAQGGKVEELPITHCARQGGRAKFGALNRIVPGLQSLLQARRACRQQGGKQRGFT